MSCMAIRGNAAWLGPVLGFEEKQSQFRNPELKSRRGATHASAAEGADAASSAWPAKECNRILRPELHGDEEQMREGMVSAAKARELAACGKFEGSVPVKGISPPNSV